MSKIKTTIRYFFLMILFPFYLSCGENPKDQTSQETSEDVIIDETEQSESDAENGNFRQSALEEDENWQISDLLIVDEPSRNESVSSPLKIKGKARGSWFFEGVAPVTLVDNGQKEVATGIIEAKGDWMTEDFVPFEGTLEFDTKTLEGGFLIFKRANPSGKADNEQTLLLPVEFSSNEEN